MFVLLNKGYVLLERGHITVEGKKLQSCDSLEFFVAFDNHSIDIEFTKFCLGETTIKLDFRKQKVGKILSNHMLLNTLIQRRV